MTTFQVYRTARTPKDCEHYPRCTRGIEPGERYLRASAAPWDMEVNQSDHWRTLVVCQEHMPCEWCGRYSGTHENGCRLGLGPDERRISPETHQDGARA